MKIVILNGSPSGTMGNSARIGRKIAATLKQVKPQAEIHEISLQTTATAEALAHVRAAQGLVFITGTYWDSWGSPLQRFLEEATFAEGTETWLGKPAAVLVTAHSVGAKGVLSRLQGVLNTLGCMIPPMTGWAYTAASQQALACEPDPGEAAYRDDFWCLDDLDVIAHNLLACIDGRREYRCWPVDRKDPAAVWVS